MELKLPFCVAELGALIPSVLAQSCYLGCPQREALWGCAVISVLGFLVGNGV